MVSKRKFVALSLCLSAGSACAGDFMLGVGAAAWKSEYEGVSGSDELAVYPAISYEGDRFSISGTEADYRVLGDGDSGLSAYISLGMGDGGYDASDSVVFAGMDDRDASIDLGVGVEYAFDQGSLNAAIAHDVSGAYKGLVASASFSAPQKLSDTLYLTPSAGFYYRSSDYVDYYYGVLDSEATSDRAAYEGDDTLTPFVGYELFTALSEHWRISHSAEVRWLGDEITDSPLVDRSTVWSAALNFLYLF